MRQQLESETQNLMQGLVALQQSAAKFASAGQSVEYLAEQKQGGVTIRPRPGLPPWVLEAPRQQKITGLLVCRTPGEQPLWGARA